MFTTEAAQKIIKLHQQLSVKDVDISKGLIQLLKQKGCKLPIGVSGKSAILQSDFLKLGLGKIAIKAVINNKYLDYEWAKSRYYSKHIKK